jgi:class 3 adenylate cyclase
VERFVGEGAKKRVYRARDTRLDRDVAIALVKAEGLDEGARARVRREAQAMGRLGDHPHIVTVHDISEEDGQLYIVSQFMSGGDVAGLVSDADGGRVLIDRALEIADQVCGALEHAHSRGIIHRDVKPGNIWLAENGTAMLGDFGLALALDQSRLTQEGSMVGTPAYLPPEQALGLSPDARSDLYALGAVLNELVCGRPPFLGDDAVSIISQHINTPPVAPSWHNAEVSKPLEALILRLLEKDPAARPASAREVSEAFRALGRASATPPDTLERAEANPLDRLAGGIFVGREAEVHTLRGGLDDALSGRGRILMLVGEPGIGKTRSSEELATYAGMRGAQVLWGRCYEGDGAPAYWPWVQILRAYVHDREPSELMQDMGPGAADIAEVVSEVRERLPGLPAPPPLDPEQARFRLFDSITNFLRSASKREPLVLILDDLHWSDKPSLLLFQFLARELAALRVLVVGTYRDVELGRQHPLEQTLAELARSQLSERVVLRGLTAEDVARFIELSAGRTPPPALADAVYRETEGNPFFVHEVVRLLQSDGRLEDLANVSSWSVEIPQGVRQVIGRRLNALGEDANRLLAVGSVIGRDFDLAVLARVAETSEDKAIEQLEEAEDARIVGEVEGRPGAYRFSHALVRETLYEELRTTRRVRLHRKVAEVLEELHGDGDHGQIAALAYHFCEAASGGDVDRAIDYAVRAAERSTELLAYEEAANHFDRALTALEAHDDPDEPLRCRLLIRLGRAHRAAGSREGGRDALRRALESARQLKDPEMFAQGALEMTLGVGSSGTAVDEEVVDALEEARVGLPAADSPLRAKVLARLSGAMLFSEQRAARNAHSRDALEMARRLGDKEALVAALEPGFFFLNDRYDAEGQLETAEELAQLARELGNRGAELSAVSNRISTLTYAPIGDAASIDRDLERFSALARETRQPFYRGVALRSLAGEALLRGDMEQARLKSFEAYQLIERADADGAYQTFGVLLLVRRAMQGRAIEIEQALRQGAQRFPGVAVWKSLLCWVLAEEGQFSKAREVFDPMLGVEEIVDNAAGPADAVLLSHAAAALGDVEAAKLLYPKLLPQEGYFPGFGVTACFGCASRALGRLAACVGNFHDAERHFERALVGERRRQAWGWIPRTQCDYASMLLEKALVLLGQALDKSQELGLKGWGDLALNLKLRAQGVDSGSLSFTGSIDVVARSIGSRRPDLSMQTASDGTVSLMFSDMEGFTAMTERLGDLKAREVIRAHNRIVREQVAAHAGHEVELQGDGFLLAFQQAHQALLCAIALQRAFASYSASHPEEPIRIRVGLHTGEALRDADKFFGRTVILAARIATQAKGGEILVSAQTKQLTEGAGEVRFGPEREAELKGIAEPQRLVRVEWE